MSDSPSTEAARSRVTSSTGWKIAVAAATLGVIYGYDIGNISGALLFITEEMALSPAMQGTVTTVLVAGNIVGALIGGKLATAIGRQKSMLLVVLGYAVFATWSGLTTEILWLDISRFFLGVSIGLSLVVTPIFLAESAPAAIRGALVVGYQVATVSGILLAYLVDWALASSGNWRLMLALSAVPSILVLFLLIRLPDTPRWYLMQGRQEEARATLRQVDPAADADRELAEISADIAAERGGHLREMFRKPYSMATMFVLVIGFLVQITGINAITYYSPIIFEEMGFEGYATILGLPAVVQAAALVATVGSLFAVDRIGRRPLLLGGITAMMLASVMMITVFATGSLSTGSAWGFVAVLLFTAGYNFGFGSMVWVFASESFPARLRTLGASLLLASNLVANLIVAQLFLPLMQGIGGVSTFVIFLTLAAFSWLFVLRFAPETKGRPLESIRTYWENGARWPRGS
ncbi:sugar porter family MFS transporter [Actinopolyspora halophila]|uniref:sugar porter family MFS transporter n=1 Tax=Actinopolyspora halophila TaxID=1850 RepID=UPI00037513E3|nr:sugar porter family MFS transporter [Actinopolyspora halophila]